MTSAAREAALAEVVALAKAGPNGEIVEAREKVLAFEQQFGMTTAELKRRLKERTIHETTVVSQWLFEAQLLDGHAKQ